MTQDKRLIEHYKKTEQYKKSSNTKNLAIQREQNKNLALQKINRKFDKKFSMI